MARHVLEEQGPDVGRQLAEALDHRPDGDDEVELRVVDDVLQFGGLSR